MLNAALPSITPTDTEQQAYGWYNDNACACLKAMGIAMWVRRNAHKMTHTQVKSYKATDVPVHQDQISEQAAVKDPSPNLQKTPFSAFIAKKTAIEAKSMARSKVIKEPPGLLGQQNIALIQAKGVLVIALIGQHIQLPEAYLDLIVRMLNRCSVNTEKVAHHVLDSLNLYANLHFCDQDIVDTLLAHIHKKYQAPGTTEDLEWIVLLGAGLAQVKDKPGLQAKYLLIQQEVVDLLSFPETRKQAWEDLSPLRE